MHHGSWRMSLHCKLCRQQGPRAAARSSQPLHGCLARGHKLVHHCIACNAERWKLMWLPPTCHQGCEQTWPVAPITQQSLSPPGTSCSISS